MSLRRVLLAVVCSALAAFIAFGSVSAQAEVANSDVAVNSDSAVALDATASFVGVIRDVPPDAYDVYVRLAQREQKAAVTVEVQGEQNGGYTAIGLLDATGESWQKVGVWKALQVKSEVSFRLSSDQLSMVVDANRPAIMLLSRSHPVCTPSPECTISVNGRTGTVLPPGNSALRDTLRVSRVISPATDTVNRVVHYLDNEPMYSTKTYHPFDFRYALHNQQKAVSVIEYASGQRVVIDEPIPSDYADNFWNFIFRTFQQNAQLYTFFLIIAGVVIFLAIALGVLRVFERRHLWRITHGFITVERRAISEAVRWRSELFATVRLWLKRVLVVCFIVFAGYGLLAAANTYVATVTRVDGVSMEDTYMNGAALLVNRAPITLAHLAGHNYSPVRGQAVIMHAVYGIADAQTSSEDGQEYIVKRVLGLPGERVVVDNGIVTVYKTDGTTVRPDENAAWSSTMHTATDGRRIDITLGNDEVFVNGDNRPLSMDSRVNGAISTSQITGVVVMKL